MAFLDNLSAFWKLDEVSGDALDSHSGGLTLADNATVASATGRVYALARDFESGNSEFFSRAATAALTMGLEQDFTLCAMVKLESVGADRVIVSQYDFGNVTNQRGYALYYQHAVTKFTFLVSPIGGAGSTAAIEADVPSPVSAGTWYFIVAWHDATANTINIQVNGGTVYSESYSAGVHPSTAGFRVGCFLNNGAASGFFDGLINAVGVWKRVLTATERAQLRMHRTGGRYPFPDQPPTLLAVGDTQNLTTTAASVNAWGQWIADYATALNLKLVLHLGDHTEFGFEPGSTFAKQRAAIDLFVGSVVTTLVPGNHDLTGDVISPLNYAPVRDITDMSHSAALPMTLVTGKSEFGQQMSATGYNQYAYTLFIDLDAPNTDLFIVLPFAPTTAQLAWARGKAAMHPQRRCWIVVHDFAMQDGTLISTNPLSYCDEDAEAYHLPDDLWDSDYSQIPNLVAIFCGHAFFTGGSADLRCDSFELTGEFGNTVLVVVANNQERNGVGGAGDGAGYLLICEMSDSGNTITAESYMPVSDIFPTVGSTDSFTHDFNFAAAGGGGGSGPGGGIHLGIGL